MSFESDLDGFSDKVERLSKDAFVDGTVEVRRSIVEGAAITGLTGATVNDSIIKISKIETRK